LLPPSPHTTGRAVPYPAVGVDCRESARAVENLLELSRICSSELGFYPHYDLHARRSADTILYTQGSSSLVTQATASVATGWSEPVPGRVCSRSKAPSSTAHPLRFGKQFPPSGPAADLHRQVYEIAARYSAPSYALRAMPGARIERAARIADCPQAQEAR
jgi:hypothetical protein